MDHSEAVCFDAVVESRVDQLRCAASLLLGWNGMVSSGLSVLQSGVTLKCCVQAVDSFPVPATGAGRPPAAGISPLCRLLALFGRCASLDSPLSLRAP